MSFTAMQAEMVRVKDSPARLYLAGADLFDRPDIQQALAPACGRGPASKEYCCRWGSIRSFMKGATMSCSYGRSGSSR